MSDPFTEALTGPNMRTIKPSNHQTIKPSNHQTNHQTIKAELT